MCSFVGHLEVRNGYNAKKPVKDTSMSKELARTVITYTAKNGDDKVRAITVPFSFGVPLDAAPTFTWVSLCRVLIACVCSRHIAAVAGFEARCRGDR